MPSPTETVQFLSRVPLFSGLKKNQIEKLASRVVVRHYPTGQDIVTQGQVGAGLFILVSGQAEAVLTRMDGSQTVVNTFGSTDFFGELALLDAQPRTATITTLQDTECLVLSQWEFFAALREDSDIAIHTLQEMARRFRKALSTL